MGTGVSIPPIDDIINAVLSGVESVVKNLNDIDFDQLNQNDTLTQKGVTRLKNHFEYGNQYC